ncbi:MAG: hypothetical protein ACRDRX_01955 [Pseudonocardiaceae bacterium]
MTLQRVALQLPARLLAIDPRSATGPAALLAARGITRSGGRNPLK